MVIFLSALSRNNVEDATGLSMLQPFHHLNQGSIQSPRKSNRLHESLYECQPTHHACDSYDGLLHIKMGDYGGAGGTIFFQFVIGQLIYAEQNNLLPFIHLDKFSHLVYDPIVHGTDQHIQIQTQGVQEISTTQDLRWRRALYPGPPIEASTGRDSGRHTSRLNGTGVWDHYFSRVSDYCPTDISCQSLPYLTMTREHVSPGLHLYAPWAPKIWRYGPMPDFIGQPHLSLRQWLLPQRLKAAEIVNRYYKFQASLTKQVNFKLLTNKHCLGLHIRWSDKGGTRRLVHVSEFLPYVQTYLKQVSDTNTGIKPCIYVATDSIPVLDEIKSTWPTDVQRHAIYSQASVRSPNTTAVFHMTSHHLTNTEVLRDILELSKCQFLIHGKSAVSESAMYLNPDLIYQSINLELDDVANDVDQGYVDAVSKEEKFGAMVSNVFSGKITSAYWKNSYKPPKEWWEKAEVDSAAEHCQDDEMKLNINSELILTTTKENPYSMSIRKLTNRMFVLFWKQLAIEDAVVVDGPIWSAFFQKPKHMQRRQDPALNKTENNCIFSKLKAAPTVQAAVLRLADSLTTANVGKNKKLSFSRQNNFEKIRSDAAVVSNQFVEIRQHIKAYADTKIFNIDQAIPAIRKCLGLYVSDPGYHRDPKVKDWVQNKYPEAIYDSYIEAFIQSGGNCIYLASDSYSLWKRFLNSTNTTSEASSITEAVHIYTLKNAVRNRRHVPAHYMEERITRLGSEILVDVRNLSRQHIHFLVHAGHPIADAALLLNPNITSIHVQDPDRLDLSKFAEMAGDEK